MITRAEVRQVEWLVPAGGAARSATRRTSLLLALVDDRGQIAFGEAAPLPGMSSDSLDDARRDLELSRDTVDGLELSRDELEDARALVLSRETVDSRERSRDEPDEARRDLVRSRDTLHPRRDLELGGEATTSRSPSARFAIETALLGLRALARGRTLHADLDGAAVDRLPLAAVVDHPDEAIAAVARGISTLKIKVGPSVEHVREIHRAVPAARLRLDANRAWTAVEAMERLSSLAGLPIDFVEEPCVDAQAMMWPVPIALDESLAAMSDAEIQDALRTVDALVLKPTLLGLDRCRMLAAMARREGKRWTVTHGLEGPIGTAACAELALAIGGEPAGLAAHGALAAWDLEVPQLGSCEVRTAGRPGLGLELASLDELVAKVRMA